MTVLIISAVIAATLLIARLALPLIRLDARRRMRAAERRRRRRKGMIEWPIWDEDWRP